MDLQSNQVLFFVGPPSVGKTLFFKEKLSDSYVRFSPKEEIARDNQLGLRQLALKIVKLLRQGQKVAVDDENKTRKLRKCYISIIKDKVPDRSIAIIHFRPNHGIMQLLWNREFMKARAFLAGQPLFTSDKNPSLTEAYLQSWLDVNKNLDNDDGPTLPQESEGCAIKEVSLGLQVETERKFEIPGLFIQWQSLLKHTPEGQSTVVPGVVEAVEAWYTRHKCGRVIIIIDGKRGAGKVGRELEEEEIVDTLSTISKQISDCPIYALFVENLELSGDFANPPGPGLIAFAQRLHFLDLQNKGTIYLYTSQQHLQCATAAGVKHMKAGKAFSNPSLFNSGYGFSTPSTPSLLTDMVFIRPVSQVNQHEIPLAEGPQRDHDRKWSSVKLGSGRILYMFYKDASQLERYVQDYKSHRTPINEEGSRIAELNRISEGDKIQRKTQTVSLSNRSRDLPKWMFHKERRKGQNGGALGTSEVCSTLDSECIESCAEQGAKRSWSSQTVYVMDEDELIQTAKEILEEVGQFFSDEDCDIIEEPESNHKSKEKGSIKERHVSHINNEESVPSRDKMYKKIKINETDITSHLKSHAENINTDLTIHGQDSIKTANCTKEKQTLWKKNMSNLLDDIICDGDKKAPPRNKRRSGGRISPDLLDF